jgi:predicted amidohydrolase YtcJ
MKHAYIDGRIYQGSGRFTEAMWVGDGRILATGKTQEILALIDPDTHVQSLQNKTVIPGFNDAHLHFYNSARVQDWVQLWTCVSIDDLLHQTSQALAHHSDDVLYGMGWNQEKFDVDDKRFPSRMDLDRLNSSKPIVLYRVDGHVVVLNSLALARLFDPHHPPSIEGGVIDCDAQGVATGVLREKALDLLVHLPESTNPKRLAQRIDRMVQRALSYGITSVQVNDLMLNDQADALEAAYLAYFEQHQTIRLNHQICFTSLDAFKQRLRAGYSAQNSAFLRYGPLKLFADGTLGAKTAALRHSYRNEPNNFGVLTMSDATLQTWIQTAHAHQVGVVVHAIGDRALHQVLDAYASLNDPQNQQRNAIIHVQISDYSSLKRMEALNIGALVQPIFLNQDWRILHDRVEPDLAASSYAFNTLNTLKLVCAYSSDAPIESINPFENLHCAVLRQDLHDQPEGGFYPNERVSLMDALDAYTAAGAYFSFEEQEKGRLETGYLADFAILDRDIFELPLSELKSTQVLKTFVHGNCVYEKDA